MIEITLDSVRVVPEDFRLVVLLKEKHGPRYLPIWITEREANTIASARRAGPSLLEHHGTSPTVVLITLAADEESPSAFLGPDDQLRVDLNGQRRIIHVRPRDGLALAVGNSLPILVEEAIIDAFGMSQDDVPKQRLVSGSTG